MELLRVWGFLVKFAACVVEEFGDVVGGEESRLWSLVEFCQDRCEEVDKQSSQQSSEV